MFIIDNCILSHWGIDPLSFDPAGRLVGIDVSVRPGELPPRDKIFNPSPGYFKSLHFYHQAMTRKMVGAAGKPNRFLRAWDLCGQGEVLLGGLREESFLALADSGFLPWVQKEHIRGYQGDYYRMFVREEGENYTIGLGFFSQEEESREWEIAVPGRLEQA